jgi:hypothetical protein
MNTSKRLLSDCCEHSVRKYVRQSDSSTIGFVCNKCNEECSTHERKPEDMIKEKGQKVLIEGKMILSEGKLIPMVPADRDLREVVNPSDREVLEIAKAQSELRTTLENRFALKMQNFISKEEVARVIESCLAGKDLERVKSRLGLMSKLKKGDYCKKHSCCYYKKCRLCSFLYCHNKVGGKNENGKEELKNVSFRKPK